MEEFVFKNQEALAAPAPDTQASERVPRSRQRGTSLEFSVKEDQPVFKNLFHPVYKKLNSYSKFYFYFLGVIQEPSRWIKILKWGIIGLRMAIVVCPLLVDHYEDSFIVFFFSFVFSFLVILKHFYVLYQKSNIFIN